MKVGVGADHGGFEMKQQLAKLLRDEGHEVIDF
jgi:ribose 5-phosphate isomerase B